MKSTNKREINLDQSSQEHDLKKSLKGCVPCLEEANEIERKVNKRSLRSMKINEIKEIVNSIFESSKNGN